MFIWITLTHIWVIKEVGNGFQVTSLRRQESWLTFSLETIHILNFWNPVCSHSNINNKLSTLYLHNISVISVLNLCNSSVIYVYGHYFISVLSILYLCIIDFIFDYCQCFICVLSILYLSTINEHSCECQGKPSAGARRKQVQQSELPVNK